MPAYTIKNFSQALGSLNKFVATNVLSKIVKGAEIIAASDVKQRFMSGTDPSDIPWAPLAHPRASGLGGSPLRDTGQLMASISSRVSGREVTVFTTRPGASIHNTGGVIKATRTKFLAIPMTSEAARAGSPRMFGRQLQFVPFRSGKGALVEVQPGRHGPRRRRGAAPFATFKDRIIQYLLVSSVMIPKREFMGLSNDALGRIDRLSHDELSLWAAKSFR